MAHVIDENFVELSNGGVIVGSECGIDSEVARREAQSEVTDKKRIFGNEASVGKMAIPFVCVKRRPSGCCSARGNSSELRDRGLRILSRRRPRSGDIDTRS